MIKSKSVITSGISYLLIALFSVMPVFSAQASTAESNAKLEKMFAESPAIADSIEWQLDNQGKLKTMVATYVKDNEIVLNSNLKNAAILSDSRKVYVIDPDTKVKEIINDKELASRAAGSEDGRLITMPDALFYTMFAATTIHVLNFFMPGWQASIKDGIIALKNLIMKGKTAHNKKKGTQAEQH